MKKQERTLQLRKHYAKLFFEAGKGPAEQAAMWGLSVTTVYRELPTIAEEYTKATGIPTTKKDLLVSPGRSGERQSYNGHLNEGFSLCTTEESIKETVDDTKKYVDEVTQTLAESRGIIAKLLDEEKKEGYTYGK